jgi:hypothetical protein
MDSLNNIESILRAIILIIVVLFCFVLFCLIKFNLYLIHIFTFEINNYIFYCNINSSIHLFDNFKVHSTILHFK